MKELLTNDLFKIVLRGNHDLYIPQYERFEDLASEIRKKFDALPDQVLIQVDNGKKILLCHSTPDNSHFIYLDPHQEDYIKKYTTEQPYDGFWFGHTHYHYFNTFGCKFLFNPGSLGDDRDKKNIITLAVYESTLDRYSVYGFNINNNNSLDIVEGPYEVIVYNME